MRLTGYMITAVLSLSTTVAATAQGVSRQSLAKHIEAIRAGGEAGRPAGSGEGEAAANYIAGVFEHAGLFPYYAGQYIDEFTAEPLVGEARKTYRNVAGIIYGSSYELDGDYIVVGAHYDYAGPGGSSNTVVEDNTSGVAALLEMAGTIKSCLPGRNIIFVAFDGFEQGLLGSRRFMEESTLPAEDMLLVLDLSRIGRMPYSDLSLQVGGNTIDIEEGSGHEMLTFFVDGVGEKQLGHLIAAAGSLGVRVDTDGYANRSDSEPFIAAGVPAVNVTVGSYRENIDSAPEDIDTEALSLIAGALSEGICAISRDASINIEAGKVKSKKKRGPRFEGGISLLAGTSFFRETDGDIRGKTLFSGGAGVYGQLNFARFLGLRPEVQYIHSGSRYAGATPRMNSVVVPVSLVVQTPPYLAGSLQLLVGGYYRRTFNNTSKIALDGGQSGSVLSEMYHNGAGVQWGLNLRLKKFGIGVVSRYGLTDLYRVDGDNMRERATYGTISYNF